jgi:hypothetical protein
MDTVSTDETICITENLNNELGEGRGYENVMGMNDGENLNLCTGNEWITKKKS